MPTGEDRQQYRTPDQDLILPPGQFAYILDETKGVVAVHVGPTKTGLSNTDKPVFFDGAKFVQCELKRAIQQSSLAGEGDYIVLENPPTTKEAGSQHPTGNGPSCPTLDFGRKINIAGPITFALWPGQIAKRIPGHRLRTNQYLLCRIYNDVAASENWDNAVLKPQTTEPSQAGEGGEGDEGGEGGDETPPTTVEAPQSAIIDKGSISMGKLFVVDGGAVSFYIPPTGVEILPNEEGEYVRDAVTLERLEYSILVDEDGNKRYERGPAVVFPKPTESFIKSDTKSRRFKAYELNDISGIYVKVIADYSEGQTKHVAGNELFITGKDQAIYFPRPEHAIIRYGDQDVHYAIAIPAGEGRYYLDRMTGKVELVEGPKMFLPDPRTQVIVKRVLTQTQVNHWYPGNTKALDYNRRLAAASQEQAATLGDQMMPDMVGMGFDDESLCMMDTATYSSRSMRRVSAGTAKSGDELERKNQYTPPRSVVLDSKFDGIPVIQVWTGYAVQVNDKAGNSRVVPGPAVIKLAYDETLEVMKLSKGKPKSTESLLDTAYLRSFGSKVSDIVTVETKDMCRVDVKLSHRVHFEGDEQRWFAIENYVKFMCDHVRSMLKGTIKKYSIEDFYANSIDIIRTTILGAQTTDEESGATARPGLSFDENGMRIYDVEVLNIEIGDQRIAQMLEGAQHTNVQQAIEVNIEAAKLEATEKKEAIKQKIEAAVSATTLATMKIEASEAAREVENRLLELAANLQEQTKMAEVQTAAEEVADVTDGARLARQKNASDQRLAFEAAQQEMAIEMVEKEAAAIVTKFSAMKGDFAQVALALSNNEAMKVMANASAPLTILGGDSIAGVLGNIFKDTPYADVFKKYKDLPGLLGSSTEPVETVESQPE